MTGEEYKDLIRRFIEEVVNGGNAAALGEYCVSGAMLARGLEGQVRSMKTAFPDLQLSVEEMVVEDDRVAVRVVARGTNSGPLVGLPAFGHLERPVPPTGRATMATGMYFFTLNGGKIVSVALELDQVGLLRQMGWTFVPPHPAA